MGRLARELIRITDPRYYVIYISILSLRDNYIVFLILLCLFRTTVYIEHSLAWYDIKTQNEILNYQVFSVILETVGTPGLSGLDKLISFFIVMELETLVHHIERNIRNKTWMSLLEDCETMLSSLDNAKGKNLRRNRKVHTIKTRIINMYHKVLDRVCLR